MLTHNYYGMLKRCPNRTCKHPFDKDCHKGWMPKSVLEAFVVMRCPRCHDTFMVVQPLSHVHLYKEQLPDAKHTAKPGYDPITQAEQRRMKKALDTANPLSRLSDHPIRPTE